MVGKVFSMAGIFCFLASLFSWDPILLCPFLKGIGSQDLEVRGYRCLDCQVLKLRTFKFLLLFVMDLGIFPYSGTCLKPLLYKQSQAYLFL
ncbi:hypothetical protein LINPERPRIM_LOCUS2683 [Linum perenne]